MRCVGYEKGPRSDQGKPADMVQGCRLFENQNGKGRENGQGNCVLNGLEFGRRIGAVSDAIGRDVK